MVRFKLNIHQTFDLDRIQIPANHHAQIVGHKFHNVMIVNQIRIFAEYGTGFRILDVAFD